MRMVENHEKFDQIRLAEFMRCFCIKRWCAANTNANTNINANTNTNTKTKTNTKTTIVENHEKFEQVHIHEMLLYKKVAGCK